jgi:hypothetical protein
MIICLFYFVLGTIGFGVLDDDDDDILYSETSTSNFHTSIIDDDEDTIVMGGKKLSKYLPSKKIQEKRASIYFIKWNRFIYELNCNIHFCFILVIKWQSMS